MVPWPGIKPTPPALESRCFPTGPRGKIPSLWFSFASPLCVLMLSIFSCVYLPSIYLLWWQMHSNILLNLLFSCLSPLLHERSFYSISKSLIWNIFAVFFQPVVGLLNFLTILLKRKIFFLSFWSSLTFFLFYGSCFWVVFKNTSQYHKNILCFLLELLWV